MVMSKDEANVVHLEPGTSIWIVMKNAILRFGRQCEFAISIKHAITLKYILKFVWHVYACVRNEIIKKDRENITALDRLNGSNSNSPCTSIYIHKTIYGSNNSLSNQNSIETGGEWVYWPGIPQMFTNGKSFGCEYDMSIQTICFVYTCRAIDAPFQNNIPCNNK